MPQNLFQEIVFTLIMVIFMVFGMITYNVALTTGTLDASTFVAALGELYIMAPIAFVLEFFVVGKLARKLAFSVMRPGVDRPQFITYAISICICCIMCPVMSLIGTLLFNEPSLFGWLRTWACNFPMAIFYQLFYCGPFVRLVFRTIFRTNKKKADEREGVPAAPTGEAA